MGKETCMRCGKPGSDLCPSCAKWIRDLEEQSARDRAERDNATGCVSVLLVPVAIVPVLMKLLGVV